MEVRTQGEVLMEQDSTVPVNSCNPIIFNPPLTFDGLLTSHSTRDRSEYMTASFSPGGSKLQATASGKAEAAAAAAVMSSISEPGGAARCWFGEAEEATGTPSPASSRGRFSLKASVLAWKRRTTPPAQAQATRPGATERAKAPPWTWGRSDLLKG